MKQAKQYKRTYKPFPIYGKLEAISVSCDEKGRYAVFRDGRKVNHNSAEETSIINFFCKRRILEQGKQGYVRCQSLINYCE